ncbi:MAG: hypothetical protein ACE149_03470 [Armatimonadota bacterium]
MKLQPALALFCCLCAAAALAVPALAADNDSIPKTALVIAAAPAGSQPRATDAAALTERVLALEKENVVLREDLGKARLDLRTGLNEQAKQHADEMARMQQKIDELNAQLAAEHDKQAERNRTFWLAIGVLFIGVLAAN